MVNQAQYGHMQGMLLLSCPPSSWSEEIFLANIIPSAYRGKSRENWCATKLVYQKCAGVQMQTSLFTPHCLESNLALDSRLNWGEHAPWETFGNLWRHFRVVIAAGCYWHLLGRDQEHAQDSPTENYGAQNVSSARKPYCKQKLPSQPWFHPPCYMKLPSQPDPAVPTPAEVLLPGPSTWNPLPHFSNIRATCAPHSVSEALCSLQPLFSSFSCLLWTILIVWHLADNRRWCLLSSQLDWKYCKGYVDMIWFEMWTATQWTPLTWPTWDFPWQLSWHPRLQCLSQLCSSQQLSTFGFSFV